MATQTRYLLNRYPWLASVLTTPNAGNIFFVDGNNGVDTRDGTTPETAVLTITHAIDNLVTANQEDYVIVLGFADPPAATETWPIACDKDNIHIIGMGVFGMRRTNVWADAEGTAAFEISENDVEIAGFDLAADAAHGCIENSGSVWRAWIHHNEFGRIHGAQDGILQTGAVDNPHWLIEHNTFGHLGTLTRSGIRIEHNSTRSVIRNNLFYVYTGAGGGIHFQGLCTAIGYVLDNRFKVPDAVAGEAIYVQNANASVCQFHGNEVASGVVAMGFNPYRDLGVDTHWGLNYAGLTPTYPVTV